jgi:polar amino acid transport system substrate-binding protein
MSWCKNRTSQKASELSSRTSDCQWLRVAVGPFSKRLNIFDAMKAWQVFAFLALACVSLIAQTAPTNDPQAVVPELRVLVRNVEPFCMEKDGQRTGFVLELWGEIAREAGLKYEVQTADSAQAVVDALAARKADVGLGALSITLQREQSIDFSYPFYNSGLDIVTATKGVSVFRFIGHLFNSQLLKTLGLLLLVVIGFSHVLWWLERHINHEDFPKDYKTGLGESIWWTVCVMITLACDRKAPKGIPGRIAGTIWMIGGVVMVSLMTASFSSSLTVSSLSGEINGPGDLAGHTVATVTGSTAEKWLTDRKISVQPYPGVTEAIAAVSRNENGVLAAVYDEPILRFRLAKNPDKHLRLVGNMFEKQGYGIGLQLKSPYLKLINKALLKLNENKVLEELNKKWFGEAAAANNG